MRRISALLIIAVFTLCDVSSTLCPSFALAPQSNMQEVRIRLIKKGITKIRDKDRRLAKTLETRLTIMDPRDNDAARCFLKDIEFFLTHASPYYSRKREPKVTVVVLHYGESPVMTHRCLRNISTWDYPNMDVILIDNASPDRFSAAYDVDYLTNALPGLRGRLKLISNRTNLGYCGGNNQAARMAIDGGSDYVFFFNNDTLLGKEGLSRIVSAVWNRGKLGAVMPQVLVCDKDWQQFLGDFAQRGEIPPVLKDALKLSSALTSIMNIKDRGFTPVGPVRKNNILYSPNIVPGTALLLRADVLRVIGGYDSRYFMYMDENEMANRLSLIGLRCAQLTDIPALHPLYTERLLSQYFYSRNHFLLRLWYPLRKSHFADSKLFGGTELPDTVIHDKGLTDLDDPLFIAYFKGFADGLMEVFSPTQERDIRDEFQMRAESDADIGSIRCSFDLFHRIFWEKDPQRARLLIFSLDRIHKEKRYSPQTFLSRALRKDLSDILLAHLNQWRSWVKKPMQDADAIAKIQRSFLNSVVAAQLRELLRQSQFTPVENVSGQSPMVLRLEDAIELTMKAVNNLSGSQIVYGLDFQKGLWKLTSVSITRTKEPLVELFSTQNDLSNLERIEALIEVSS